MRRLQILVVKPENWSRARSPAVASRAGEPSTMRKTVLKKLAQGQRNLIAWDGILGEGNRLFEVLEVA